MIITPPMLGLIGPKSGLAPVTITLSVSVPQDYCRPAIVGNMMYIPVSAGMVRVNCTTRLEEAFIARVGFAAGLKASASYDAANNRIIAYGENGTWAIFDIGSQTWGAVIGPAASVSGGNMYGDYDVPTDRIYADTNPGSGVINGGCRFDLAGGNFVFGSANVAGGCASIFGSSDTVGANRRFLASNLGGNRIGMVYFDNTTLAFVGTLFGTGATTQSWIKRAKPALIGNFHYVVSETGAFDEINVVSTPRTACPAVGTRYGVPLASGNALFSGKAEGEMLRYNVGGNTWTDLGADALVGVIHGIFCAEIPAAVVYVRFWDNKITFFPGAP